MILHTELAVDVHEIPFHCGNREEELLGDFAIGESVGDQRQNFLLPLAEGFDQSFACLRRLAGQRLGFSKEKFI